MQISYSQQSSISLCFQNWFDPHKFMTEFLSNRVHCPCCGYATLEADAEYEVCELCNWEDDGQSDADANDVRGGPNADYSLTEARKNFAQYRVMYEPDRDMRITGPDTTLQWETKGLLMQALERLAYDHENRITHANEVLRLEKILRDEMMRRVRDYEARR